MRLLECCVISVVLSLVSSAGLKEEFTWTRISYAWRNGQRSRRQVNTETRSYKGNRPTPDAILFEGSTNNENPENSQPSDENKNGPGDIDYRFENNIPMGSNVWQNKLFITVPRRRLGVPSTLNYVPLNSPNKHNVPLIPYPNWDKNLYSDTSGTGENFVSVYRVAVDKCDRLWFVDTGTLEIPGNKTKVKPTTLIIMDLQTDKVIQQYVIPLDQLRPTTTLASVTVDVSKTDCDSAYAYLPDLGGYGLIVYSLKENKSWRVTHNYFYLEPLGGEFNVAGHQFQWNDGVFSVELTAMKSDGYRDLYFHSMAGTHIYKVSTRILRDEALATRSYHENDFQSLGDRGPLSQTSSADLHKSSGTLFLGLVNQNALGCWNIERPLDTISVVQKDDQKMIYPSDVKVYNDKVYLLTNTMPGFLYGRLNYDEVNFRVWSNGVLDAVLGTKC
ncbi:L-dopachrome tautomerase yellow-f2-like [Anoplophora glabripennis]|uniref:L-dopachrome tautomerase yellow-f2-like n=1 Tax=Anoplophora glabripennis TaxID=217634 RepID=UPI0008735798|nr:L-dopachrome tautomerase yellow-f2-like [Anoplophora glabripennis]